MEHHFWQVPNLRQSIDNDPLFSIDCSVFNPIVNIIWDLKLIDFEHQLIRRNFTKHFLKIKIDNVNRFGNIVDRKEVIMECLQIR